jgi:hypothetical protein
MGTNVTENGNGWTKYVVGVLVTLVLFVALPTMATQMITNDRMSRERDEEMQKDLTAYMVSSQKHFNEYTMKQEAHNGEIKSLLVGLSKDIEYLKRGS